MSLFYGYKSKEEELEERVRKLEIQLPVQFPFHRHNIVFDFNVTRASKNTTFWKSKPEHVSNITDRDGESKTVSVLFWDDTSTSAPVLDTSGKHHFLSPKNRENVSMSANCPLLRHPDVSVFVVLKRNSIKLNNNKHELIFSDNSKGVAYYTNTKGSVNVMNTEHTFNNSKPFKDLSEKHVISVHWRSEYGQSHLFLNNSMKITFINSTKRSGESDPKVFGRSAKENIFSDVSIYEIKVIEGYLTVAEIRKHIADIMDKNDIS